FLNTYSDHRHLHPFPTRRSSDLAPVGDRDLVVATDVGDAHEEDGSAYRLTRLDPVAGEVRWSTPVTAFPGGLHVAGGTIVVSSRDRKSTRLNSSHVKNSYAVFCL